MRTSARALSARAVPAALVVMTALSSGCDGCKGGASTPPGDASPGADAGSDANVEGKPYFHENLVKAAQVQAVVNPSNLPAYAGAVGSIEGTVFVKGDPAPPATDVKEYPKCPAAKEAHGTLFREGPKRADGSRPLPWAVLGVTEFDGAYIAETAPVEEVLLDDCADTPRAITMTYGQRLEVANKTKLVLGPVLVGVPKAALMLAPPNGPAVKIYVPQAGHFRLSDQLGTDVLDADVYVMRQPLHAVSDRTGHFRIDGIPVGKRKLHARLAAIQTEGAIDVEVLAGVVQKVDLTLDYAAPKDAALSPSAAPTPKPSKPVGPTR